LEEAHVKRTNKRALSLALALVMMFALVGSVAATETPAAEIVTAGYGKYIPDPNSEELWFQDTGFTTRYNQILNIEDPTTGVVTPTTFDLGINTVEIINYKPDSQGDGYYNFTLHPEYFGPANPPYDDQYGAQYDMDIEGLSVYNPCSGNYRNCYNEGFPRIPDTFALRNADGDYYFKCVVTSTIENLDTGGWIDATWTARVVYFEIPDNISPVKPASAQIHDPAN
jgi:hypothetical protein